MKRRMTMMRDNVGLCCWNIWSSFTRKKTLDVRNLQETQLQRCLGVIDLTALGIGSTFGSGIYLLIGSVAKNLSGPAVVVSFLIAAFASFLAGICFAEFSARVPRAGSAYIYSYVSVGEFWAFVIGWNMILENIIGAAASGKAWSQFMDSMFNDSIRRHLEEKIGLMDGSGWFDSYPDFLALGFLLVATAFSCVGVKISSRINVVFTVVNMAVIICIIGVGFFYANVQNWSQSPGGFFPFGFRGVMAGAATCFYSFVGFDAITTSGEESTNPTRHVPMAIVITLVICLIGYLCVSSVLTLMVPWNTLAPTAALPKAFAQRGIIGAEYVIAVGGVCGLSAATLTSLYPLPRNIYSMAQDGLLFQWLGHVWKRTDTPVVAACVSGILVALSALLLDLDSLIEMMSIGTLMAYTMVAVSVLVLHYQKESVGLTASNSIPDTNWGKDSHPERQRTASSSSNQPNHQQQNSMIPNSGSSNRQGRPPSNSEASKISMSEDTGLLKVGGEGNNKVRYVPTKTTTVVKKIKPRDENDDSEVEDNAFADPPPTPTSTTSQSKSAKASVSSQSSVVEEYRAKVRRQQEQQRHQEFNDAASNISQPYSLKLHKGSYHPMDNSVSSLSTLSTEEPTNKSRRKVIICTVLLVIVWMLFCVLSVHGTNFIFENTNNRNVSDNIDPISKNKLKNSTDNNTTSVDWISIAILSILALVTLLLAIYISRQPKNQNTLNFKTPLIPWLPLASVMTNIFLMMTLSDTTWIRFIVWLALGSVIYFSYGMWHSAERRSEDQEVILYDITEQDSIYGR